MADKIIRCSRCGERMERPERVRLALSWEYPKMIIGWNGKPLDTFDMKSRSRIICRTCAAEIAGVCGIDVPKEAMGA